MASKSHKVYNVLTLDQKVKIIEQHEKGVAVKELCKLFKCGKAQIYTALKKKNEIKEEWAQGANYKRKRGVENEDIDDIVWTWFVDARSRNLPISGPILQAKAIEVAEKLGKTSFKASNGWLVSFKKRHNICCKVFCGEAKDVDDNVVNVWKENLKNVTCGYELRDIFNCDETGLFFRALPTKSLCVSGEKCIGGKHAKERLTVFLCCNMKGETEIPLVIGKAAKPRCFKNINIKDLPVMWRSNRKAWMTAKIMEEWLQMFNNKMKKQKRKVILFLDNAACHPHVKLSNVELSFLPSNTTAKTQPLDQGIIYTVKMKYRKLLLQSLIVSLSSSHSVNEPAKSVNVLNAIHWLASFYQDVSPLTIEKRFRKAGFPTDVSDETLDFEDESLQNLLNEVTSESVQAEEFINLDSDVCTEAGIQSIDDLILNAEDDKNENEDEDDEEDVCTENDIKTYKDALQNIHKLQNFSLHANNAKLLNMLSNVQCEIEKCICEKNQKQTSIKDYFK